MKSRLTLVLVALCVAVCSKPASADIFTFQAIDSGNYSSTGRHTASNISYISGDFQSILYNHFFVFDLSTLNSNVDAATIRLGLNGNGYGSGDASENHEFFHVATNIATLRSTHSGTALGQTIFNDLGTGTSYGDMDVTSGDQGTVLELELNAAALADIQAAGGLFAIGGSMTTVTQGGADELVYVGSHTGNNVRELVIQSIPEPGTFGLTGLVMLGAAGGFVAKRLRKRKLAK